MSSNPENYKDKVPDRVDKTQEEWEDLGYHGQYYYATGRREKQAKSKAKRREEKRDLVNRIKKNCGCINCDVDEPVCLDFHHIRDKKKSVTSMVSSDYSKENLKKEIRKCVVICSNCHRKHHAGIIDINEKI